jgi:hypothetical protein
MAFLRYAFCAVLALVLTLAPVAGQAYALETAPDLPDAPQAAQPQTPAPASAPDQSQQTAPMTPEERTKKAQEQLEQQEHQRVWAVVATFNTTTNQQALPLNARQKYQLFFKSAFDPWPFLLAAVLAGTNQAENSFPEYGQGVQGYAKRFGASYGDYFIGNFMGNAALAVAFKEDPRYYQKGHGKFIRRALWAASGTVWCKRDSGTWGPNYANVIGTSISNVYYPAEDRTVGGTISRGFSVTAQGIIGSEVIEFSPDIVRHHRRKQAEKLAKKGIGPYAPPPATAQPAPNSPQPTPAPHP